jgi:hypothetical protein
MAPEFMQRFSRNAELDAAEIAGREGGEKLLGKAKALELLELRHGSLQTREAPTPDRSFQRRQ